LVTVGDGVGADVRCVGHVWRRKFVDAFLYDELAAERHLNIFPPNPHINPKTEFSNVSKSSIEIETVETNGLSF